VVEARNAAHNMLSTAAADPGNAEAIKNDQCYSNQNDY